MRKLSGTITILAMILAAVAPATHAQSGQSPYAGQQKRDIKALSNEEIAAYLEGQGMGLAKAAELNSYPGPKHVLDMASELQLSDRQRAETQKVFDRMLARATRLGKLVVAKEEQLDRLFASRRIDQAKLRRVAGEIARLQGELRVAHLRAHLETKAILTQAQVEKYAELRGYKADAPADQHKGHKH
jgi:Spy/CpxP family protein refolding chaperone